MGDVGRMGLACYRYFLLYTRTRMEMWTKTKLEAPILFTLVAVTLSAFSYAETRLQPSDAELGQSALNSFFKTNDREFQADRISEARDWYAAKAQTSPDEVTGATVIFSEGKSPAALQRFLNDNEFKLVSVEIKIPHGSYGVVRTLSLGAGQLMGTPGTDLQRLEAKISEKRREYNATANLVQGDEAKSYKDLATAEFKIFRADVEGQNKQFREVLSREDVIGVFPDPSDKIMGPKGGGEKVSGLLWRAQAVMIPLRFDE